MKDKDEYPSWKEALFSDDKLINLRCIGKWFVWNGAYMVMTVFALLFLGGAKVFDWFDNRESGRATGAVSSALKDSRTKKAGRILWVAFVGGYLTLGIGWIGYVFIQTLLAKPVMTIAVTVGVIVASILIIALFSYGWPLLRKGMRRLAELLGLGWSKTVEKSKQTPGLRRVIGRCPVHFDIEPKWFDRIFERFEESE